MTDKCQHCGSIPPPPDAFWHPTSDIRIVPRGPEFHRVVGKVPAGGLFPRMESVDLRIVADQNYDTERLWIRTWAESEWRNER